MKLSTISPSLNNLLVFPAFFSWDIYTFDTIREIYILIEFSLQNEQERVCVHIFRIECWVKEEYIDETNAEFAEMFRRLTHTVKDW
jgi:hypothetical protein